MVFIEHLPARTGVVVDAVGRFARQHGYHTIGRFETAPDMTRFCGLSLIFAKAERIFGG